MLRYLKNKLCKYKNILRKLNFHIISVQFHARLAFTSVNMEEVFVCLSGRSRDWRTVAWPERLLELYKLPSIHCRFTENGIFSQKRVPLDRS